jgi:hypothetical protein
MAQLLVTEIRLSLPSYTKVSVATVVPQSRRSCTRTPVSVAAGVTQVDVVVLGDLQAGNHRDWVAAVVLDLDAIGGQAQSGALDINRQRVDIRYRHPGTAL